MLKNEKKSCGPQNKSLHMQNKFCPAQKEGKKKKKVQEKEKINIRTRFGSSLNPLLYFTLPETKQSRDRSGKAFLT